MGLTVADVIHDPRIPYMTKWHAPGIGSISRFDVESSPPPNYILAGDMRCVALSLIFVLIRLRLRYNRGIANAEDVIIIIAWLVFATAMSFESAGSIIGAKAFEEMDIIRKRLDGYNGTYYNVLYEASTGYLSYVKYEEERPYFDTIVFAKKLNWMMQVFYHTPLYLVKFAWLLFYKHLIPRVLAKTRALVDLTIFFCAVGYIVTFVLILLTCNMKSDPYYGVNQRRLLLAGSWNLEDNILFCSPFVEEEVVYIVFAFHSLSEILVYVIPLLVVFRLRNISIAKKISIAILFLLGFFCLFLMIFNVWLSSSLIPRLRMSYNLVVVAVFWPLEPAWAIIVTCLPAFRATLDEGFQWTRQNSKNREKLKDSEDDKLSDVEEVLPMARFSGLSVSERPSQDVPIKDSWNRNRMSSISDPDQIIKVKDI